MSSKELSLKLPYHSKNWTKVKPVMQYIADQKCGTLMESMEKILEIVSKYYGWKMTLEESPFVTLNTFFDKVATEAEKAEYLQKALPKLAEVALGAEQHEPPGGLQYSLPDQPFTVALDRRYTAGLVAMGFLCLYNDSKPKKYRDDFTTLNFVDFFQVGFRRSHAQCAKLKCILQYFVSLSEESVQGHVSFHRVHLAGGAVPTIEGLIQSDKELCHFQVDQEGIIEDSGSDKLQVDFANEYIGGGVLNSGRVQEEIRFSVCPELLASMLFMARMEAREAIVMRGFQQFSAYTGYADSFTFAGPYTDQASRMPDGSTETTLVAIDAIPYWGDASQQYQQEHMLRDICKAYAGFSQSYMAEGEKKRLVATGNWGCGAFRGDPQLKSLLQWVAASEGGCPGVIYYAFGDKRLKQLSHVVEKITEAKWKVCDLMVCLQQYSDKKQTAKRLALFEHIENAILSTGNSQCEAGSTQQAATGDTSETESASSSHDKDKMDTSSEDAKVEPMETVENSHL